MRRYLGHKIRTMESSGVRARSRSDNPLKLQPMTTSIHAFIMLLFYYSYIPSKIHAMEKETKAHFNPK